MANKLALSDEILLTVDKPARYIGNEVNSVKKDPNEVDIRFAMCFPDVYEIGMSHLGIQILYDMFNWRDDVYCERVYAPWTDLDAIMREQKIPLFALESQDPIKEFDFLGITIQYEMCYTNILQILDLSQIPIWAKDRRNEDPIVIGGGPCTYNPEPIADFFDLFYIGEGETVYDELLDLYKEERKNGYDRKRFLRKAAGIEGIYVPSLYKVTYLEDGTVEAITPMYEDVPAKVNYFISPARFSWAQAAFSPLCPPSPVPARSAPRPRGGADVRLPAAPGSQTGRSGRRGCPPQTRCSARNQTNPGWAECPPFWPTLCCRN